MSVLCFKEKQDNFFPLRIAYFNTTHWLDWTHWAFLAALPDSHLRQRTRVFRWIGTGQSDIYLNSKTTRKRSSLTCFSGTTEGPTASYQLPSPCSNYPKSVWPGTGVWKLVVCLLSLNAPRSPWARREPAGPSSPAHLGRGTCCSAARSQRAEPLPTPGKTCWLQRTRHKHSEQQQLIDGTRIGTIWFFFFLK